MWEVGGGRHQDITCGYWGMALVNPRIIPGSCEMESGDQLCAMCILKKFCIFSVYQNPTHCLRPSSNVTTLRKPFGLTWEACATWVPCWHLCPLLCTCLGIALSTLYGVISLVSDSPVGCEALRGRQRTEASQNSWHQKSLAKSCCSITKLCDLVSFPIFHCLPEFAHTGSK